MLRDTLFLAFVFGCIWMLLKGLSTYHVSIKKLLFILFIWILLLTVLGFSGLLSDFSNFPPRMVLVLIVPMLVIVWFTASGASDNFLSKMPAAWIVKMQGFRVIVEIFIWWAFIDKLLPIQMTFEGRNFDILVGLTAPLVAFWCLKGDRKKSLWVLIWNILGLILLFNIIIIAVLSMPTPKQYFFDGPSNTIVATFPWILLPGILVMLAFALHLLSIKQMIRILKTSSK